MDNVIIQKTEHRQRRALFGHPHTDILHRPFHARLVTAPQRLPQLLQIGIRQHIHRIPKGHILKTDDFIVILKETVVKSRVRLQICCGAFGKILMIIAHRHHELFITVLPDGKKHAQRLFDPIPGFGEQDKQALAAAHQMYAIAVQVGRLCDYLQHLGMCLILIAVAALSQQNRQIFGIFNLHGNLLRFLQHFLLVLKIIPDKIPDKPGLLQLEIFLFLLFIGLYQHLNPVFNTVQVIIGFLLGIQQLIHFPYL